MSRWIDADALKKMIDKEIFRHDTIDHVFQIIDDAPSIEIIRCRECKHWKESQYYPDIMVCTYLKGTTFIRQDDDFCSRGEPNKYEEWLRRQDDGKDIQSETEQ